MDWFSPIATRNPCLSVLLVLLILLIRDIVLERKTLPACRMICVLFLKKFLEKRVLVSRLLASSSSLTSVCKMMNKSVK